jgi:2-iminobutanoate/2-iminopropanoate deaminase
MLIIMKKLSLIILLVILASAAFTQTAGKQIVSPANAPRAIGPYSPGVLAGNTLYCSGQIAINPETGLIDTSSIESETRQVLKNLGAIFESAGMTYQNVVKATIFMVDIRNYKLINSVYAEFFKEKFPAREAIQVVALPAKAHVEISAIAVK